MPTTTTNGVPYPLGTDPLGETDLRVKALAEYIDDLVNTRANVYAGAAQTLTTAVAAALAMNSEDVDPKALHSTVTNNSRITVATPGRYLVVAQVGFVSNATGYRQLGILKNGTAVASVRIPAVSGTSMTIQCVADVLCVATDYIEAQAVQTSGGNLDTVAGSTTTFLHATFVGKV